MILSDHTTCTKPEQQQQQQRTKRIENEERDLPVERTQQLPRNKHTTNGKINANKTPNRQTASNVTIKSNSADSAAATAAIRILKSYYNKDALASVNESFLNLDENYSRLQLVKKKHTAKSATSRSGYVSGALDVHVANGNSHLKHLPHNNNTNNPADSPSTSSSYSLSSNSTNHKPLDAEQQQQHETSAVIDTNCSEKLPINRVSDTSSFSCVTFVNQLVEGRLLGDRTNNDEDEEGPGEEVEEENGSESSLSATKEPIFEREKESSVGDNEEEEEEEENELGRPALKRLNFNLNLVRKKKASLIKRFSNKSSSNTSSINSECTAENASDTKKPNQQQDIVQIGVKLISKLLNNNNNNNTNNNNNNNTADTVDAQTGKDTMYHNSNTLKRLNTNGNQTHYQHNNNHHHKPANLLSKKLRKLLPFNYGLKNHGNTCFMNCILQSLFHTSPLSDFFLTHQFEHDIKQILAQQQQQQQQHKMLNTNGYSNSYSLNPYQQQTTNSQTNGINNKPVMNQFILTRHFNRLLASMWQNTYEPAYSAELKQLIGYINPVFAGVNQNDSHEFCIWLLDRLSQELTYKYMSVRDVTSNHDRSNSDASDNENHDENNDEEDVDEPSDEENIHRSPKANQSGRKKRPNEPQNCSFIEDLFKIKFKSTIVCSKCNYKSSKYETDMMLSLPLPQQGQLKSKQATVASPSLAQQTAVSSVRQFERRSFYFNLILSNQTSIKSIAANGALTSIITSQSSSSTSSSSTSSSSSSAFLNANTNDHHLDYHEPHRSKFYITETSLDNGPTETQNLNLQAPLHIKIAVNANLTTDNTSKRELINETSTSPTSSTFTVINPNFNDLRLHIESSYKLNKTNLVFFDLNQVDNVIFDEQSIKQYHRSSSLVALELVNLPGNTQMPFINIVSVNVYQQQQQQQSGSRKSLTYGLPFAVLINRDCSYSELCQKLLEAQSKYLKDKNMLKYKELAVKMFTLSLYDVNTRQCVKLNSTDELPLYAECVDKALNESVKLGNHDSITQLVEHIRINIEWRSYDDISNFFREIDYTKAEYVHKTVKQLQRMDENDQANPTVFTYETNYPSSQQSATTTNSYNHASNQSQSSNITTLNDCFELFTQCEELTDENSWTCTKCKKQTNAYKKLGISSVPPILIIHLKRFFYKSKTSNFKLTTPVWFPVSNLDMSKYLSENGSNICNKENEQLINMNHTNSNSDLGADCVENRTQPNRYIYDLFAVCNHKGQNMANGHYTAYCKNTIDTRWYCFDDSNCSPLYDTNNVNIHNTGSSYVCTENAYILFYKKRECLRNERWWVNYIDRSLFDYDEFEHYLSQLNAIERQQHATQSQQQQKFLQSQNVMSSYPFSASCSSSASSTCSSSGNQTTIKKANGLRSIKDKILGNANPPPQPQPPPLRAGTMYEWERAEYDSIEPVGGGYMCERELNRQAERERQEQILKNSSSRNNLINLDAHQVQYGAGAGGLTPAIVNHYDEYNKPQRLLKKNSSKEFHSPVVVNHHQQTASATSTPSTASSNHDSSLSYSSSYNRLSGSNDKNLITFQDPVIQQIDNLSKEINKQVNLNNNDFIFDYPNDNEYTATDTKATPRARKSTDYGQYGSSATGIYNPPVYYSPATRPTSYLQFQPSPMYHHQLRQRQLAQQQHQHQHQQQSVTPESHRSAGQSTPPSNSNKNSSNSRYINPTSIETPI